MATSEDDKTVGAVSDIDPSAEKQLETLISATESGDQMFGDASNPSDLESIEVMLDDQSDLVDLDALFDALNVVARSGGDAVTLVEDTQSSTILTVNADLISNAMVDELDDPTTVLKDQIISDES